VQLLSEDLLRKLIDVEGRYIEWHWDTFTLTSDHVAMREPGGTQAESSDARGRQYLQVPLRALEELIQEQLISEDESEMAAGYRRYRSTEEGRKRGVR
jgi:hypothetical protein